MPLQDLKHMGVGEGVALWHIVESEAVLSKMVTVDFCPDAITHLQKRKEWLAGRVLAKVLAQRAGLNYKGVGKDEYGKPFLKAHTHRLSLSHSFPYVVAQLHALDMVGIDIEQPRKKILKVVPRALHFTEIKNAGGDIIKLCVYWCAKEALYKIHGKKGISFAMRLRVEPFDLLTEGDLLGAIVGLDGCKVLVHLRYIVSPRFVLVYSKTP